MFTFGNHLLNLVGRVFLVAIFLLSTVGNKIPNFNAVAGYMSSEGVPAPQFLLAGAIVFLLVGSASILLGFRARFGASLLAVFLILASYYFHDFWTLPADQQQDQMIQFLKNLGLLGAMLIIMSQDVGGWTVDHWLSRRKGKLGA